MASKSRGFLFQFLIYFLHSATSTSFDIPILSPTGPIVSLRDSETMYAASVSEDFQTFFYNQTLDHFNYLPESYTIFQQRYVINSKFWGGANASSPILVYFGAEQPLDNDLLSVGFPAENAFRFNALLLYIEHRYYGKSIPSGSMEEALKNPYVRGYFNSAQAMADYAEIIILVKKQLHAENSPVIVIGGSYGGMLASWFRLKFPHITLGALASSAPILYFDDITPEDGYYSIASKVFREVSETCYLTVQQSWDEIEELASKPNGLSVLSKKFKTCNPLNDSGELMDYLGLRYTGAAQYNNPPVHPRVTKLCSGIDGGAFGSDTLSKIFGGLVAYEGTKSCYINEPRNLSQTDLGWRWQTCSDMVMPIGSGNESMFPPSPFNLDSYINDCKAKYGVAPRPHWVTAYFGGHSVKLVLQRFGSNIIFSNGLKDPYSSGGVLDDISDTVTTVKTLNGSHCLDILYANETDPEWLVAQRETEIKIIQGWIDQYYIDLRKN